MKEESIIINPKEAREECLEALYRLERAGAAPTLESLRDNPDLGRIDIADSLLDLIERGEVSVHGPQIRLRRPGRALGRRIFRRHEVAEGLFRLLGLKREHAHREACRLEHVVTLPGERSVAASEELARIEALLERGAVPLVQAVRGIRYRVGLVSGGHGARRKLEDLGVSRNAEISVCTLQGRGPVEILVRGSHLALGRGIASKVLVVPEEAGRSGVVGPEPTQHHHRGHHAHGRRFR